jgi:3D (Asp-Asp-Asp) domain-containing protein
LKFACRATIHGPTDEKQKEGALMKRLASCLALLLVLATATPAAPQTISGEVDPFGPLIDKALTAIDRVTNLQLRATFYHAGAKGIGGKDSLGCRVAPMRTLAVDPSVIPKHSIVFIKETVGMIMPDGSKHDGMWYASDTGGAIKGKKVDLFTGLSRASMEQFTRLALQTNPLNAVVIGRFDGCPPK